MANRTNDSSKAHSVRKDRKIVAADGSLVTIRTVSAKKLASYVPKHLVAKAIGGSPRQKTQTLHFGSVTIMGGAPAPATIQRNISLGQSALKRGLNALVKPGVKLPLGKGVPKYHADPNDPTILIRELNGRHERGILADGEFKIAK